MNTISTHTFKYTLRDIHKNAENRKFCFVIGAGASRKSGIPTGGELSEMWFPEIKAMFSNVEFETWVKDQKIEESDLASKYGSIYRKRFENDKTSGYEFLVQAMKYATPSFGHIVLAQILSRSPGHCVLTTNFDSLVESSVYQFTNKTPLVCGHESLSGYARPSNTHPLVIKIHRDLLLDPKSDPDEINILAPGWKEPLDHIFSTHIPIVIGYGGNDGSLMSYFETMNKPSNFFWCGLDKNIVSHRIKSLIETHDGRFIKIEGFDELMHELLWVFDEIKPIKDELSEITNDRIQIASKQLDDIITPLIVSADIDGIDIPIPDAISKELSALEYSNLADRETDFEKRKLIYLKALEKYPDTGWLWAQFTYFLHFVKKDYLNLNEYYQRALKLNLDNNEAAILGNYAIFLVFPEKDYVKAEEYYSKSFSINPNIPNINNSYAIFLQTTKTDYLKAEEFFIKALSADPNNALFNINYANFLRQIKKDYPKAEEYYLNALFNEPNEASHNSNYAIFLHSSKRDYLKAGEYYLKALSINPDNANANGNYAQILIIQGKLTDAQKYIQSALNINGDLENDLLLEMWFYLYAHFLGYLEDAESKIEDLLSKGIRSIDWNFDENIKRAIKDGHPNPEKLKEFARRITSE